MAITLPNEYSYVLAAVTSTFFVNRYHSMLTGSKRRASGIKYPTAYASQELADRDPKAYAFNCAQRAHSNFLEILTPAVSAMLIAGLRFPRLAAGLGGVWSLARVYYAYGYVNSGPRGRTAGSYISLLAVATLELLAAYTSVSLVLEHWV